MITKAARTRWLLFTLAAGVLVLAIVLVPRQSEARLPSSIASLKLIQSLSGREASALIDRMHAKGVSPRSNEIGVYMGEEGNATIYMSVYTSETDARSALKSMQLLISVGNPIFTNYVHEEILHQQVSSCFGQGQEHYFFALRNRLYWLAVDKQIAIKTIEGLLRTIAEDE